MERKIVLANGVELMGKGFGYDGEVIGELVMNTAMVGYQEAMSDPASLNQLVLMTYPLIGNYGFTDEDYESKFISFKGLIVREYNDKPSNFRYTKTLAEVLEENNIVGLCGIDTRKLTRILQAEGSQLAILCDQELPKDEALKKINEFVIPTDPVRKVSCKKIWYSRCPNPRFNVVAIDFGIKYSFIRSLNERGCNVTIVPCDSSFDIIMATHPDGILLSNGPGNPNNYPEMVDLVKKIQGIKPMFGIGFGCELLALGNEMKVVPMKNGHHSNNLPIRDFKIKRLNYAPQNHDYDIVTVQKECIRSVNGIDETIEGIEFINDHAFGVQYYPETAPRSKAENEFDEFVEIIEKNKKGEN